MKKSYKKLLCMALCAVMALTGTGCSSSGDAKKTETEKTDETTVKAVEKAEEKTEAEEAGTSGAEVSGTIEIWSMMTQQERVDSFQKIADDYMASHPGTQINITVMPWKGALDKIVASVMAGNAPDLTVTGIGYPQTLAGTGGLLELSDLVDELGGKDQFLGTSLSVHGATEDGGLYSIPLYITPYVAYYRDSWVKEAGYDKIPETWEDYYDMCKAVTDPSKNRYGFALPLGDQSGWKTIWSFLQANDVDLVNVDDKGEWYIDIAEDEEKRAAAVEVYDFLYKLTRDCAPEGTISYTQTNVREMVAGGTVMSRIDTPEIYYNVESIAPDDFDDFKYFKIPGRKTTGSGQGWVGLSVTSEGNTELAKDFIRFMYSGDEITDFYLSYPYAMFPAKSDLFNNKKYQENLPDVLKEMVPDMALDILATSSGVVMSNGPFPAAGEIESQNTIGNALVKMLTEGYTAEQAVDYLIGEIEKVM